MIDVNHIEKTELPIELDFQSLKEKGLEYIQEHSSMAWTNLNSSDPGVTILEQFCYAFTELGYCNNFPIRDILTDKNNELEITNQFYLPEQILTSTPVTIEDYTKYVIDRVDPVKNTLINVFKTNLTQVKGAYQAFLLLNNYQTDEGVSVCNSVFYQLNNVRNLGEFFFLPNVLSQSEYLVNAYLEIEQGFSLSEVVKEIQYQINNYIFPDVVQTGYTNLKSQGLTTNEIFDGPILKNGWIPDSSIKPKKELIKSFEITKVIQSIAGVKNVSNISFTQELVITQTIPSGEDQIIYLNFIKSVENGSVTITSQGKENKQKINADYIEDLLQMQQPKNQPDAVETVKMTPDVPKGQYRDIESYYSIQNTFPDSYAVGVNGITENASSYQIAQSRQLKGYLTLYDQALVNQFAQLANLGRLFSFKNSITGTPFDLNQYLDKKTEWQKIHQEYPAPFESFSPTYFYESLYETVPDIETLLKNYKAYRFSYGLKTPEVLADLGWNNYKSSPYNSYIWGLMHYMEDEEVNLNRRNEILDHLLARHGESPTVINTILNTPIYSKNLVKNQVIVKSLYLQNFQILSYNRDKAYNYLGADKLSDTLEVPYQLLLEKLFILKGTPISIINEDEKITSEAEIKAVELLNDFTDASQSNFIFDVDRIDEREKITNIDIINYATIELKLNLLLALNEQYQNYISGNPNENLLWLMSKRKGLFFIETNLLIKSANFSLVEGTDYQIQPQENTDTLSYEELVLSFQNVTEESPCYNINAVWLNNDNDKKSLNDSLLKNTIILIFPCFFKETEFESQLDFFLQNELPPQLTYQYLFANDTELDVLIPSYVTWHNDLIFGGDEEELAVSSWNLLNVIEDINSNQKKKNCKELNEDE